MSEAAWDAACNVLCVRLDALDDVLMCTPAIGAVRRANPARRVTLLTSRGAAAAVPFIHEVDGVISYAAPWIETSSDNDPMRDSDLIRQLAACQFDAAIIFTAFRQSALPAAMLCYLAGIPLRMAHCRENPYQLLTHWIPEPDPVSEVRPEVRRQLDLVSSLGWRADCARLSSMTAGAT